MLPLLALAYLALTAADHWTTYLCLRQPVPGFRVTEVNPIAAWLFDAIGLVPGIALDSVVTIGALVFLLTTPRLPVPVKALFLLTVSAWTAAAVANNLDTVAVLGLSPLGAA
jgi:hypothetical protein